MYKGFLTGLAVLCAQALQPASAIEPALIRLNQSQHSINDKSLPPAAVEHARSVYGATVYLDALRPEVSSDGRRSAHFAAGARVLVELGGTSVATLLGKHAEMSQGGAETWVAEPEGDPSGYAFITNYGGNVYGEIAYEGRSYQVATAPDGSHYVSEIDATQPWSCGAEDPSFTRRLDVLRAEAELGGPGAKVEASSKAASAGRTADVLLLYSAGARSHYSSTQAAVAAFETQVVKMNTAVENTGVNGALRAVHYAEVPNVPNPASSDEFELIVHRLQKGEGEFAGVPALRDQYDADLVVIMVKAQLGNDTCGLAIPSSRDVSDNVTRTVESFAGVAVNCPANQHTFQHEFGHILGGRHDLAQTSGRSWDRFR